MIKDIIMKTETIIDIVYSIYLICYVIGFVGCPFLICMWEYTFVGLFLRVLVYIVYKYAMDFVNKR